MLVAPQNSHRASPTERLGCTAARRRAVASADSRPGLPAQRFSHRPWPRTDSTDAPSPDGGDVTQSTSHSFCTQTRKNMKILRQLQRAMWTASLPTPLEAPLLIARTVGWYDARLEPTTANMLDSILSVNVGRPLPWECAGERGPLGTFYYTCRTCGEISLSDIRRGPGRLAGRNGYSRVL